MGTIHQNFFEYQPTKDLNRLLREYGQTCLSDNLPAPPEGSANISWQTDSMGNISAYYTPGGGGGGVNQIVAGTNVTISPPNGLGTVTINAEAGGVTQLLAGANIALSPSDGIGAVTISSTGSGGDVIPGTQFQLGQYSSSGTDIQSSNITTDATGSNLNVPGFVTVTSTTTGTTGTTGFEGVVGQVLTTNLIGPGFSFGGSGGWSVGQGVINNVNSATRGIHQTYGSTLNQHGTGDSAGFYSYVRTDGGIATSADEGVTGITVQALENTGYFHGTVASTTGTGDTAPVLAFTSGNNWTTDGAFLLNISKGTISGSLNGAGSALSLTLASGSQSTWLHSLPVTGVTLPRSSAIGYQVIPAYNSATTYLLNTVVQVGGHFYSSLANGNINNTPVVGGTAFWQDQGTTLQLGVPAHQTANDPVPIQITVTPAEINSAFPHFTVGQIVTVAGNFYPEQSKITASTINGDGTQTVTLAVRNPQGLVILFAGGIQGQYISFDANLAFSGMRSSYYAYGSLTGTDLIYYFNVAGGEQGSQQIPQVGLEAATTSGANAGFHLYPGAEVVTNNDFGFNCVLETNGVAWQAGDVVENPHYPVYGGSGIATVINQTTPTNGAYQGAGIFVLADGPGLNGAWTALKIRNNQPSSSYVDNGGPISGPRALDFIGTYGTGIHFDSTMATGNYLLQVTSYQNPSNAVPVGVISLPSSNVTFLPSTGQWTIQGSVNATTGFQNNGASGVSGTFTFGTHTVTIAGGIITSVV